jgi:pectate lyase
MKRQILIALSSIALMIGISTSAHSEENVTINAQQDNIVAQTDDTLSVLPTLLESLNIEQIQILNEQQMQESVGTKPDTNGGQCRPKPHC